MVLEGLMWKIIAYERSDWRKAGYCIDKPQTTRNRIQGVTRQNYQIVFVDTPGILAKEQIRGIWLAAQNALSGMSSLFVVIADGIGYKIIK